MLLLQQVPEPGISGGAIQWLWAVPMLPLLGFLVNGGLSLLSATKFGPADPNAAHGDDHSGVQTGDHKHEHAGSHDHGHRAAHRFAGIASFVGPAVLVLSFLLSAVIFWEYRALAEAAPFVQTYFSWMPVGDMRIDAALMIDQLSLVMLLIVTGVGMLIHVFSVGYMREDPGYPRYFAYLNLFVFFMLVLVLGANYPVMFVGWEGVGLCSYLLIGFWFSEKANADAGKKAFIVNRIGDFGFLVAMFLLFANFGSLDFATLETTMESVTGGALVTAICLFLFLGCTGK